MSRITIGIDNGLSGALVALSEHPGPPIAMTPMPLRGKAKGNEVDAVAVWNWIRVLSPTASITVLLEIPGKHSPGVQAICSMWDSFGAIRAILETREIRHHRIAPQTWQKAMLGNVDKGQTKPAALSKARQLWPSESWLATPKSKVPNLGFIDAALIAEYGRLKQL